MPGSQPAGVSVLGEWLRHIPADSDPLFRPATPADGRWQRGTVVEGIYLAADRDTVWAEWYRWLAEHQIEPMRGLPRELWRYRASLRNAVDLTGAESLATLGLPSAEPTCEQWAPFQDAGESLHEAGYDGILYRSAARPDGLCLCMFRAGPTTATRRLKPLPPPERVIAPPPPPRGLRT